MGPALTESTPQGPTGRPHFIAACFIVLRRYCIFYKLKVCGNPALNTSTDAIFPTAVAHFRFLGHILIILMIFQALHQQKEDSSLEAERIGFVSNKIFLK